SGTGVSTEYFQLSFPVGLAWESKPVVEGDNVYLTSPGVRNMLFTLDINTGKVIDSAKKIPLPGSVYSNPATASSPILLKDHVLLREMGSRGNSGPAKEVVFINKKTGQVEKEVMLPLLPMKSIWFIPLLSMNSNKRRLKYKHSVISFVRIPKQES
ncbi:hypothetical protein ACFL6U_31730, partial [Planctomycetota bacterium]